MNSRLGPGRASARCTTGSKSGRAPRRALHTIRPTPELDVLVLSDARPWISALPWPTHSTSGATSSSCSKLAGSSTGRHRSGCSTPESGCSSSGVKGWQGPEPPGWADPSSAHSSSQAVPSYAASMLPFTLLSAAAASLLRSASAVQAQATATPSPAWRPPPSSPAPPTCPTLLTRRAATTLLVAAAAAASPLSPLPSLICPPAADASALPAFADRAWEALGGGPADLYFPDPWLGVWDVVSTLVAVETPLGEDALPNPAVVSRARQQDLNQQQLYQVAFIRNQEGRIVYDRRFNTASLLAAYYGTGIDFVGRISWNPNNPNTLSLSLPGPSGTTAVRTRVTRRSEVSVADNRLETSEFLEQVIDSGGSAPRVKASRCFTKYLWRDDAATAAAGQGGEDGPAPAIVATQVVSDYLTPYDGEQAYLQAGERPVTVYTYKMAFRRHLSSTSSSMSARLAVS